MRKLIVIAVLVAAAIGGGVAYVLSSGDEDGGGERRAGALASSYSTGKTVVSIDGTNVGLVKSISCGAVGAQVERPAVEAKTGTDPKQIGSAKFEPCVLEISLTGMEPVLLNWITQALNGQASVPKSMTVQYLDANLVEKSRLELVGPSIAAVSMPAVDAASDVSAFVRITVAPQAVRSFTGSGSTVSGLASAKNQVSSNFRFTWSGLTMANVFQVEAWSFTLDPGSTRPKLGDLSIVVGENDPKLSSMDSSFKKFLIEGQNTDANETTASLEFLDPTLKNTTAKLSFSGVGWAAGELVGATSADASVAKRRYTMYVERATLAVPPAP